MWIVVWLWTSLDRSGSLMAYPCVSRGWRNMGKNVEVWDLESCRSSSRVYVPSWYDRVSCYCIIRVFWFAYFAYFVDVVVYLHLHLSSNLNDLVVEDWKWNCSWFEGFSLLGLSP